MSLNKLFFAAFVLPGQSSLLGSKKCTYGPSYWCSSLKWVLLSTFTWIGHTHTHTHLACHTNGIPTLHSIVAHWNHMSLLLFDIRDAKECNAVRHCIQTVWEKKRLPDDNDDICTICKNMVQEARDTLLSNQTQVCKFFQIYSCVDSS